MNRRLLALLAPLLVLTACGGSTSSSAPKASSNAPTAATQSTQSASPSASPSTAPTVASGNPVNGPEFCAFLAGQQSRLSADGSTAGALADLTIEFTTWLDTHAAQKPRTGADLDEASLSSCPATRTAVLATLGADSFAKAFGG